MHMKGEPMTGKENREIKNSVFVDLFYEDESAEANEIALFNAIHDEPLPEGTKIRKFRVDNTIYMNFQKKYRFENSYRSYCLHGISESSFLPATAHHGLH